MMRRFGFLIAGLLLVCVGGCQRGPDVTEEAGLKLTQDYLTAIEAGDFDAAFRLCAPEFFSVRSPEEWKAYLLDVQQQMGKFEKVTLQEKMDDRRLSGRFLLFQYSTKYEKGYTKDSITIIDKINTSQPLKIFGHKIESGHLRREQ